MSSARLPWWMFQSTCTHRLTYKHLPPVLHSISFRATLADAIASADVGGKVGGERWILHKHMNKLIDSALTFLSPEKFLVLPNLYWPSPLSPDPLLLHFILPLPFTYYPPSFPLSLLIQIWIQTHKHTIQRLTYTHLWFVGDTEQEGYGRGPTKHHLLTVAVDITFTHYAIWKHWMRPCAPGQTLHACCNSKSHNQTCTRAHVQQYNMNMILKTSQ